ncbi:hypothetical protein FHY12_001069 [Xanthomonas arboricola]|nr:hypothetical protein [Xanthomonas euroxanthea]
MRRYPFGHWQGPPAADIDRADGAALGRIQSVALQAS